MPDTPDRKPPNPGGHAASLEPLRKDDTYRGEHGAYSRDGRMLAPRAREIAAQLMGAPHVVGLDGVAAEKIGALAQRAALIVLAELRATAAVAAPASPYCTVGEAAAYLCCSKQRIYDLLSARRLRRYKDGTRVLVRRAELDAYVGTPHAGRQA